MKSTKPNDRRLLRRNGTREREYPYHFAARDFDRGVEYAAVTYGQRLAPERLENATEPFRRGYRAFWADMRSRKEMGW